MQEIQTRLLLEYSGRTCQENIINYSNKIVYLPAYSCLIVKTLSSLDPTFGNVAMDFTLCIWVGVDGLNAEEIMEVDSKFKIRINEVDVKLDDDVKRSQVKNKEGKIAFLSYVFRKDVETLYLGEDFLYTPFDTLILNTKVELTSYQSKVLKKHVRYFFHLYKDMNSKLLFKDEVDRLPEFNLAYNKSDIILAKEKKSDEELDYYPITIFTFGLYREPGKALLQAFLPMFILSFFIIITMIIDEASLADQLPNLATIFLAYVAFIPTVRASIPSVAYATFTDYTIYAYLLATLTAIGDNIMKRFKMNSDFTYYFFFFVTCVLIFTPMFFSALFMLKYKLNKKIMDTRLVRKEKESSVGFNSNGWFNNEWSKQELPQ